MYYQTYSSLLFYFFIIIIINQNKIKCTNANDCYCKDYFTSIKIKLPKKYFYEYNDFGVDTYLYNNATIINTLDSRKLSGYGALSWFSGGDAIIPSNYATFNLLVHKNNNTIQDNAQTHENNNTIHFQTKENISFSNRGSSNANVMNNMTEIPLPKSCVNLECDGSIFFQFLDEFLFREFKNVEMLSIHDTDLLGFFPNSFAGLKKLRVLDLRQNNILDARLFNKKNGENAGYSPFAGLHNLQLLNLNFNNICKIHEKTFGGLPNLRVLDLKGNRITQINDNSFLNNGNLKVLNAGHNFLQTISKKTFNGLSKLRFLNLEKNSINYVEEDSFAAIAQLGVLFINDNSLKNLTKAFDSLLSIKNNYFRRLSFQQREPVQVSQTLLEFVKYKRLIDLVLVKEEEIEPKIILQFSIRCCLGRNREFINILNNNPDIIIGNYSYCVVDTLFYDTTSYNDQLCKKLEDKCHTKLFHKYDFENGNCNDHSILFISLITGTIVVVIITVLTVFGVWYFKKRIKEKDLMDGLTPEEFVQKKMGGNYKVELISDDQYHESISSKQSDYSSTVGFRGSWQSSTTSSLYFPTIKPTQPNHNNSVLSPDTITNEPNRKKVNNNNDDNDNDYDNDNDNYFVP